MNTDPTDVQVEGLVIGGMSGDTVRIGGREVEIGRDGKPIDDEAEAGESCWTSARVLAAEAVAYLAACDIELRSALR
jgi:hypothetical protein